MAMFAGLAIINTGRSAAEAIKDNLDFGLCHRVLLLLSTQGEVNLCRAKFVGTKSPAVTVGARERTVPFPIWQFKMGLRLSAYPLGTDIRSVRGKTPLPTAA